MVWLNRRKSNGKIIRTQIEMGSLKTHLIGRLFQFTMYKTTPSMKRKIHTIVLMRKYSPTACCPSMRVHTTIWWSTDITRNSKENNGFEEITYYLWVLWLSRTLFLMTQTSSPQKNIPMNISPILPPHSPRHANTMKTLDIITRACARLQKHAQYYYINIQYIMDTHKQTYIQTDTYPKTNKLLNLIHVRHTKWIYH